MPPMGSGVLCKKPIPKMARDAVKGGQYSARKVAN